MKPSLFNCLFQFYLTLRWNSIVIWKLNQKKKKMRSYFCCLSGCLCWDYLLAFIAMYELAQICFNGLSIWEDSFIFVLQINFELFMGMPYCSFSLLLLFVEIRIQRYVWWKVSCQCFTYVCICSMINLFFFFFRWWGQWLT